MAWYDYAGAVPAIYSGLSHALGGKGLSGDIKGAVHKAVDWGNDRSTAPSMGANPYQGQWDSLIAQLQQQSNGQGPSLAGDAYKQASAEGLRQQMALSHGGSAGGARQAGMNMGRINQGQAFGYSNARLQEQLAARQQLQGALGGAGQAWFQPQAANLQAQLNSPTNMQMLLSFLSQGAAAGASVAGKAATGGAV